LFGGYTGIAGLNGFYGLFLLQKAALLGSSQTLLCFRFMRFCFCITRFCSWDRIFLFLLFPFLFFDDLGVISLIPDRSKFDAPAIIQKRAGAFEKAKYSR